MYDYLLSDTALSNWVLLRQTWTAMYKAAKRKLAKLGLTPEQFDILWVCMDYPNRLTTTELSRLIFRQSHITTGLLKQMEREGLVRIVLKRKGRRVMCSISRSPSLTGAQTLSKLSAACQEPQGSGAWEQIVGLMNVG